MRSFTGLVFTLATALSSVHIQSRERCERRFKALNTGKSRTSSFACPSCANFSVILQIGTGVAGVYRCFCWILVAAQCYIGMRVGKIGDGV
jgi:hypothetical protein